MSKKRIPALLLLLCFALMLAPTANAAACDIMFSDPTVIVGNTVSVRVYSTADIAGITMTLVYDQEHLRYSGFSGGLGGAAVQDHGGSLTVVDYSGNGSGRFSLDLQFTSLALGTTQLRPTACEVSDAGGDRVDTEYLSHSSTVTITSASTECRLSALAVSPGTLEPAFSPDITSYRLTVPTETETLYMAPVAADASAHFTVSKNALVVGVNTIEITVTAGNGTQKLYTLTVTRLAPATPSPVPTETPDASAEPTPAATATPVPTATPEPTPETETTEQTDSRDAEITELKNEIRHLRWRLGVSVLVSGVLLIVTVVLAIALGKERY